MVGPSDPLKAIARALVRERFDEVIISTLPERVSHWLGLDLPGRVAKLRVPVVTARKATEPIAPTFAGR